MLSDLKVRFPRATLTWLPLTLKLPMDSDSGSGSV
eukprot:CAMPEP_0204370150 /NCGR_PEP_ID=MMETSP0469-20131031/45533_1 /ASSEMBLY_ACC=CAM_ASM_000384 /TAXON_ID=2969 /ORGANISM="Oxyrrhis marina" /LENGTH=34 /DNA_ID= /DNA_START= /DNA_END= /DNA_ORIENTATION=